MKGKLRDKLTHTDPSGSTGGLVTIVGAAIALMVAFGVPLTPDQEKAILGFLVVAGPAMTALLIRQKAFAPAKVEMLLEGKTTPQAEGLDVDVKVVPTTDVAALEDALLEQAAAAGGEVGLAEEDLPADVDDEEEDDVDVIDDDDAFDPDAVLDDLDDDDQDAVDA